MPGGQRHSYDRGQRTGDDLKWEDDIIPHFSASRPRESEAQAVWERERVHRIHCPLSLLN